LILYGTLIDSPQAGNSSETVEETGRTDDTGSGSVEEAGRVYVYGSTLGTTDISEAGLFALYVEVGALSVQCTVYMYTVNKKDKHTGNLDGKGMIIISFMPHSLSQIYMGGGGAAETPR
jgi:hypothetical protein